MAPLLANAGIPMIFFHWPVMAIACIPVIVIEYIVVRLRLTVPPARTALGLSLANLASTVIGVPIAWLGALTIQLIADYVGNLAIPIAWAYPDQPDWVSFAGLSVLMLITYLFSVVSDSIVLFFCWDRDQKDILATMWIANAASYLCIVIFLTPWYLYTSTTE